MNPKSFDEVITDETYTLTTTAGESFNAADFARMYAMIYRRFGYNLTATANAIGRLLQSTPAPAHVLMPLIAVGLALLDEDEYCYDNERYIERELDVLHEQLYNKHLGEIGLRAVLPDE